MPPPPAGWSQMCWMPSPRPPKSRSTFRPARRRRRVRNRAARLRAKRDESVRTHPTLPNTSTQHHPRPARCNGAARDHARSSDHRRRVGRAHAVRHSRSTWPRPFLSVAGRRWTRLLCTVVPSDGVSKSCSSWGGGPGTGRFSLTRFPVLRSCRRSSRLRSPARNSFQAAEFRTTWSRGSYTTRYRLPRRAG